jgi:hypothetical protein
MLDINEAKTGAKALCLQAATLSGLKVSEFSPERLADIVESNYIKVNAERRPEAVAYLLRVVAASLESAQKSNSDTLHETDVAAGRQTVCPVFPFD